MLIKNVSNINLLYLSLFIALMVFGSKKHIDSKETNVSFACLEMTEEQKAIFEDGGNIPAGSLISNKNEEECSKINGVKIAKSTEE